jgi:hypothetical protein
MNEQIAKDYLADVIAGFQTYKKLADKAVAQVSSREFFHSIDEESNSIALIVKHIAGNLCSRWTDFLTSDGEKPSRNRDLEFVTFENESKKSVLEFWENGWDCLFKTLEELKPEDLSKIVKIRGEEHTVVKAINRSLTHTSMHIGQIVFLAKHLRSNEWQTLSIPRNSSAEFNEFVRDRRASTDKRLDRYEIAQKFAAEKEKP